MYKGQLTAKKNMPVYRDGLGCMIYQSGRVYEGQWEDDKRHGKGYEIYSNGNVYEGLFCKGRAHGKGKLQGYYYRNLHLGHRWGLWRRMGHGHEARSGYVEDQRRRLVHGRVVTAFLLFRKQSKAHGYGVHTWRNGDRYEGEWQNWLKHGRGTDLFANGDIYSGQYYKGKPTGEGQYTWKNGNTYKGQFKNGLKHGKGKWVKGGNIATANTYEGDYFMDK